MRSVPFRLEFQDESGLQLKKLLLADSGDYLREDSYFDVPLYGLENVGVNATQRHASALEGAVTVATKAAMQHFA